MLPMDPPTTPTATRAERHPMRVLDAEDLAMMAANAGDSEVRQHFGRKLLDRNPDSILGRMLVAEAAPSEVEAEALLRDAVRVGLRLWAPELDGRAPARWFDDRDTRIFMAAVSAYGRVLQRRGLTAEAQQCVDFLLKLDPADRLGARLEIPEGGVGDGHTPKPR